MKKIFFATVCLCLVSLCSCEEQKPNPNDMAKDIEFLPDVIDVYVTPETDVVPFEFSRVLLKPSDYRDANLRMLLESPYSEARIGVHYSVDTQFSFYNFSVKFEQGQTKGRYEGLHIIPEAIDRNMKLIFINEEYPNHKTLTINLIVDKENHEKSE